MSLWSRWKGPILVALLGLFLSTACGGGASARAAGDYHGQMVPLLLKNQQLAQEFVNMATRVRTKEITVEQTVEIWQGRIIPLGDELTAAAKEISPDEPLLATHHEQLVTAWTTRSEAYRTMLKAYRDHDPEAFSKARLNNVDAKVAEEQFFDQVNNTLRGFGYFLDQFPG
jgi:hypothetical protein